jgi:hypothetical protein
MELEATACVQESGALARRNDSTNEANVDLLKTASLGRTMPKLPATIESNPADRRFFSSPTKTSAPR